MLKFTKVRVPLGGCAGLLVVAAVGVATLDAGSAPSAATQPTQPSAPLAAAPAAAPAPDAQPAVEPQSPKQVIFAAFRAASAGDAKGLISRFDTLTPAQTQTLEDVTQIMAATGKLSDAIRQRFGQDVESSISRALGVGVAAFDVAAAHETIDGDRAIVAMDAGPGEINLVRAGRTWKISPEVLASLNTRAFAARVPAIERLADDIRAGKYETAQSLREALAGMMRGGRGKATTTSRPASQRAEPPARR